MKSKETYLGSVRDVNGTTISISVSKDSLTGFIYIKGQGYRVGQIGSFIRIPIGFKNLFGVISQVGSSAVSESQMNDQPNGDQWMTVQILGEGERNGGFQRGITQYPTIGDEVHLVSESELKTIYGQPDKPYFVKLGNISNAESIPALLDVNKLVTRHSAIVGTTGSGKSTTVASIVNALSDTSRYPSSRVLMLDIHGEYGAAFKDSANTYKINSDARAGSLEKKLHIPFWALNFDELCAISFGEFNNEKDRNIVMEEIHKRKADSLVKYPRKGITLDTLNTDSPIPFSIHELWLDLYIKTFGTYYKNLGGRPADNIAYETDSAGTLLKGDAPNGIPPVFKNVKNEADDPEKIHYLPESNKYNFGKQLTLLGSKLRIPRYSFIFNAGEWNPDFEGKIDKDLDELLFNWIGSNKTITILDLSGVPSDILHTVIGILLRILYEALFWSRFLSQGGKHRPLLLVMEEAHLYLNDAKENMASATVQRIVKEGRKYGIGSMIVSQRPSEINPTILSQCGTFITLRLTNTKDRSQITSAMPDNLDGLTSMLPILNTGEAIIIGESVKLPMRTLIKPPPINRRPDSQDPIIYDEVDGPDSQNAGGWGIPMEQDPKYDELIEAWRSQNPRISRIKEDD